MGSRSAHQLSNGLYVSGKPETPKERTPTIFSTAMPYTGGDIKKSGELGKMFDLPVDKSRKSGPQGNVHTRNTSFGAAGSNSGSFPNAAARSTYSGSIATGVPSGGSRNRTNSGPLNKHGEPTKKSSGPQSGGMASMGRQYSGPQPPVLPTTGLITSGPVTSGPQNSSGGLGKLSGALDSAGSMKLRATSFAHSQAVSNLGSDDGFSVGKGLPKPIFWAVVLLFVMGFIAGGFILGAVHNPVLLIVVVVIFAFVTVLLAWNLCCGRRGVIDFMSQHPDADLRTAKDGEYVKVTGVVTCGNFPLESSYQRVPRCVYTSTRLYEYRGWESKAANTRHRRFTWGLRSIERLAVDFYVSDFQSGLRALVKTGYGAKVTPYVDESVVVDVNPENKDMSPEFMKWLRERNLSCDDRVMRLKEGYIKEGTTVSVMGVIQRNDNVLMIVPPSDPYSTGCHWFKCFLPTSIEGIVLRCEDASNIDVIAV